MENKGIKFCKELIVWVKDYLKDNANIYRTKLSKEICKKMEWKALVCYHTENSNPPEKLPTLKEAVLMVGKLAGHLDRKSDGMPGVKKMWKGLQRLDNMTEMWIIMSGYKRMPG